MARLIISNNDDDLFIQMEWLDQIGAHTKRITEEMPPSMADLARSLIDWANNAEATTYAPVTEKDGRIKQLDQEIGRLTAARAQLLGR